MFIIFALCSCDGFKQNVLKPLNLWEPLPAGIGKVPEGGSPEFTQGWEDGCHTGLAAYGGGHYRGLGYAFKQDFNMIHNPDYYMAWQDSYLYCRWYIWNYIRQGQLGYLI